MSRSRSLVGSSSSSTFGWAMSVSSSWSRRRSPPDSAPIGAHWASPSNQNRSHQLAPPRDGSLRCGPTAPCRVEPAPSEVELVAELVVVAQHHRRAPIDPPPSGLQPAGDQVEQGPTSPSRSAPTTPSRVGPARSAGSNGLKHFVAVWPREADVVELDCLRPQPSGAQRQPQVPRRAAACGATLDDRSGRVDARLFGLRGAGRSTAELRRELSPWARHPPRLLRRGRACSSRSARPAR